MKSFVFFITLFFAILAFPVIVFGQSQDFWNPEPPIALDETELIVVYNRISAPDSANIQNKAEQVVALFIGRSVSRYRCYFDYQREEFLRNLDLRSTADLQEAARQAPRSVFQGNLYKNYLEGKMTVTDRILSDSFIYEEEMPAFSWTIHNELSTYKGYGIQKATCNFGGREWIAWFSTEIPYSTGPHKFSGLPGLILKVYDTRDHHRFEMVSVEAAPEGHIIGLPDRKYIETTRSGFIDAREAFVESIRQGTNEFILDPHQRQIALQNLTRPRNPIELVVD